METVVWALFKLSFEHFFVESALFEILSNRDVRLCLYAYLLSSSRSDISIMSRISAGVFCTFLVYCQIPWDSIRISDNSGTEKLSPRTVPGKRLRSYVLTGLYSEASSGMSTPQLFSTLLTFVSFVFEAIMYYFSIYYMLIRSKALLPRPNFVATSWISFNQLTFW